MYIYCTYDVCNYICMEYKTHQNLKLSILFGRKPRYLWSVLVTAQGLSHQLLSLEKSDPWQPIIHHRHNGRFMALGPPTYTGKITIA